MVKKTKKLQWWETLFDKKYLNTYIDSTALKSTDKQVDFLLKKLHLKKNAKILDLACGHGRHAIKLAKQGYSVTGLDFSKHFIKLAKEEAKKQDAKVSFICDDMRKFSFVNKFNAVISMFTSFGYFDDDNDNILVLKKISRALKPKGIFFLDINNPICALSRMLEKGKINKKTGLMTNIYKIKLSNGIKITEKDEFNPKTMRRSMMVKWKENGRNRSYKTNVRMFTFPELKHLMETNGLIIEKSWGNFNGASYGFNTPRLIILARKS